MSIHVRDSDGSNFKFTTWADEPLETVMKHYCEKKGLRMGMGDLRFLVDGEKVPNTSTLLSHDLENEDIVDIAGSGVHV
jgi:hypothetical protein